MQGGWWESKAAKQRIMVRKSAGDLQGEGQREPREYLAGEARLREGGMCAQTPRQKV